jgi:glycosyltransferase EpsE
MKSTPKVSVIMGIYNCADTLSEALDSIVAQTYKNWEIIMCDDGSKDNTYNIAKEYVKKYPDQFILIKNNVNMGLNITLNNCLSVVRGEYIARMDGDDISLPTRFQKQVDFLDQHPEYALVGTGIINFDSYGDWGTYNSIENPTIKSFVNGSDVHTHATCMIRRKVYEEVGGYTVDKRMLRFEDINLWYKIYGLGYIGYNIQEALYKVRDDKNAYKRRTLKSRMNATYVEYIGYRLVKMPLYNYPKLIWIFLRNLILGVMPWKVYMKLHRIKQRVEGK